MRSLFFLKERQKDNSIDIKKARWYEILRILSCNGAKWMEVFGPWSVDYGTPIWNQKEICWFDSDHLYSGLSTSIDGLLGCL